MASAPDRLGSAYPVRLAVFEGPLDLLLHLIEREELDITEVSLVAVTDPYLEALEESEEIEPGSLADFLLVAARLLYLKSRSLLPAPGVAEEDDEEDAADELIRQLLEYRRYKAVAAGLQERVEAGLRVFVRLAPGPRGEPSLDISDLTADRLAVAVQKALRRMPVVPPPPPIHTYAITVAEQIQVVRARLTPGHTLPFPALLSRSHSRLEIVVTFLAVLELIKQKEIEAEQERTYGEILLRARG